MHLITHQGLSLSDALATSRKDDTLLQKYLYISLGMQAGIAAARGQKRQNVGGGPRQMPAQSHQDDYQPNPPHQPRAVEKEQPESKEWAGWKAGGSKYTPDGKRLKCGFFQQNRCTMAKCDRVHTCFVCNGEHGMMDCPRRLEYDGNKAKEEPPYKKGGKGGAKGKKGKKGGGKK